MNTKKFPMIRRVLISALLCLATATIAFANDVRAKTPGKIGVYCKFKGMADSPAKIRQTLEAIKAAGIDFVIPNGKNTGGKVFWESKIAPPELILHPKFLGCVVEEAHRLGLKVCPCIAVATEGGHKKPNLLLKAHPSWAFIVNGAPVGFIDPGNAEATKYEIDLITELVANYDVDGLSLDYTRAPNSIGYTRSGRKDFLDLYKVDLAEVVKGNNEAMDTEGGKKARRNHVESVRNNPIWPKWHEWRREKLNAFIGEIHDAVKKVKPEVSISTYCWGARVYSGNYETCQDWKTWVEKGWLDWINPTGYCYTDELFRKTARANREMAPKGFPFYITIGVFTSHGKIPDVDTLRRQMAMSKEAGADGLVFYTWTPLSKFMPEAAADVKNW
ncbi:MAG: glycoside hydrolase family 10 protein [Thermoguttaceae bacterium]